MNASTVRGAIPLPPQRRWIQRLVIGVILLSIGAVAVLGGISLVHAPAAPKRQMAHIMLLPDAPPPPPPPEEKKPPPPKEAAAPQPVNAPVPKVDTPPSPEPLKMEGAAGEGNSMFQAGEVKQEYIGGDIGNGSRYAAYVARLEQRVQVELSRHKLHVTNVRLFLWLTPDGAVQRYTVKGGDEDSSRTVREALADFTRVDEAPLADMPMPVGLSIN